MLFLLTWAAFLLWAMALVWKGRLPLLRVLDIYVCSMIVVDFGDVFLDFVLNCYDLPAHLMADRDADHYLGIIFSDGMIFPLVAIVFTYYVVRFRRPWLASLICAVVMGLIEALYVKLGFMVYHLWRPWITPLLALIGSRIYAASAPRFLGASPPIPRWFRMLCFTYAVSEWPGGLAALMHLYHWRPGVFANPNADDRIAAMLLAVAMGGLAAAIAAWVRPAYKLPAFLSLGVLSALLSLWAYARGWVLYTNWNGYWTVVRYVAPYLAVYWYDRPRVVCWQPPGRST